MFLRYLSSDNKLIPIPQWGQGRGWEECASTQKITNYGVAMPV